MRYATPSAVLASCALIVAACSSGSDSGPISTEGLATTEVSGSAIADVCPNPLIVQTDWFPEAEHGAAYNLLSENYEIDTSAMTVTAELQANGVGTGIDLEIRTGGPAIGDQQVSAQMYQDRDITFGFVNSDESLSGSAEGLDTLAVVAPLEVSPQMIMWSPEVYPQIKRIADLKAAQVEVFTFSGDTFVDYLVGSGLLDQTQINGSYDGSPGNFLASGGTIAQQGFASSEPYFYEFEFEDWLRPVTYELIHDTGYELYVQQLVIRRDAQSELAECLKLFVPLFQQSAVDYVQAPERANDIIVEAVAAYDSFWVYGPEIAAYSVRTQVDLGIVGNGPNETSGDLTWTASRASSTSSVKHRASEWPTEFGLRTSLQTSTSTPALDFRLGVPSTRSKRSA
ncbi:MAG: ABC transporter substrate-binding protein [Acidimicrobiales bacterium]